MLESGYADRADRVRPSVIVESGAPAIHDLDPPGGFDLRGYYHWTLVDNFEWDSGWELRFGLFELDDASSGATPRPSAVLYSARSRARTRSQPEDANFFSVHWRRWRKRCRSGPEARWVQSSPAV